MINIHLLIEISNQSSYSNYKILKIKSFHEWANKCNCIIIWCQIISKLKRLVNMSELSGQDDILLVFKYRFYSLINHNLPVMANSKVNNHCSILISIDLYILGVTKRRKYEIKTIHRAYDYLFGFRNESTTPSGCSIPSVLNNKFSHSL